MIFISYGAIKSASSFAFLLANDVAIQSEPRKEIEDLLPPKLQSIFIQEISDCIDELVETVPQDKMYVVKTHQHLDKKLYTHLRMGTVMASISYRDPYDILVSLLDAGKRERAIEDISKRREVFASVFTLDDALAKIPWILSSNRSWLDLVGILPRVIATPFEMLRNHPRSVVAGYARMMDVEVDASRIVNKFLENRELITEYNRGEPGRGHKEIQIPVDHPYRKAMDQFVNQYLNQDFMDQKNENPAH